VRKVLRQALQHHPTTTLTFCFGCLGTSGRNSSSSAGSGVGAAVVQGVRLWLGEHILVGEASPSREGTPMDCDGNSGGGASSAAATLAAASAAGAAGVVNGGKAHKSAGAAAPVAAAGGSHMRSCVLQSVLESSAELRAWVRKEAKGMSRGEQCAVHALFQQQRSGQVAAACINCRRLACDSKGEAQEGTSTWG
jgi:hypothetical protein